MINRGSTILYPGTSSAPNILITVIKYSTRDIVRQKARIIIAAVIFNCNFLLLKRKIAVTDRAQIAISNTATGIEPWSNVTLFPELLNIPEKLRNKSLPELSEKFKICPEHKNAARKAEIDNHTVCNR